MAIKEPGQPHLILALQNSAAYAIMSNHYHIVVRINAEEITQWSDEKVAQRWMQVFGGSLLMHQHLMNVDLTKTELSSLTQTLDFITGNSDIGCDQAIKFFS